MILCLSSHALLSSPLLSSPLCSVKSFLLLKPTLTGSLLLKTFLHCFYVPFSSLFHPPSPIVSSPLLFPPLGPPLFSSIVPLNFFLPLLFSSFHSSELLPSLPLLSFPLLLL